VRLKAHREIKGENNDKLGWKENFIACLITCYLG